MDPATWQRVRTLFAEAHEVPEGERAAWLGRTCADEPRVRAELERLLEAAAGTARWPRPPARLEELLEAPAPPLQDGERIGPYRVLSLIAVGGMGAVYCAEQERPRRLVALKTLRAGRADAAALRRFRAEAEVLGHLQHPGIAQIYDAGSHEQDGVPVPFLAMEYVEGARSLVEHARERELGERERLELFLAVCDAVQHGHQRGVIHRDLKPGNVLVDHEGRPKVIDFGLARALDREALGISLAETQAGEILGTLAYMSPEHISGNPLDIDVRSDVYALGCLLCELLSGRPPLELDGLPLPAVARSIVEDEPQLSPKLAPDLRWILAMALEKDPARRYGSASELAADLRRYLQLEPVTAGPPSSIYRLKRLARRHRAPLVGAAAVLVALLVGLLQARSEARAADSARGEAQESERQADEARTQAERQAELARISSFFLSDLFKSANLYLRGREARVVDTIELAESKLFSVKDPTARAIVTGLVGQGFLGLDERERAAPLLREAVEVLRRDLPPDDLFRLRAEVAFADLLEREQQLAESLALSEHLLPRLERALGPDHELTLYLRTNLAICYDKTGAPARAERLYRQMLELVPSMDPRGARSGAYMNLLHKLGSSLVAQGRFDEGLEALDRALALFHELGDQAPLYEATFTMDVAGAWFAQGEPELALEGFQRAAELYEGLQPSASNRYAVANNLAWCLLDLGRVDEAVPHAEQLRELVESHWEEPGSRHIDSLRVSSAIATQRGEAERGEELARQALELALEHGDHPQWEPLARDTLARALLAGGRAEQAVEEARRALESLRALDPASSKIPAAQQTLTRALLAAGRGEEAAACARELVEATPADSFWSAERERLLAEALERSAPR